jgi:hypothetical protein
MEMVMKRYINDARAQKERPIPVKITRSVGLQVHMGPLVRPRQLYYLSPEYWFFNVWSLVYMDCALVRIESQVSQLLAYLVACFIEPLLPNSVEVLQRADDYSCFYFFI